MTSNYNLIFKIVLIGDSNVGKTNILSKYLQNEFNPDSKATVGVEFGSKTFNINDNVIKAQIWDTAGTEKYRSITNAYYKGAKGAFVVYDITKKSSFNNIDKWLFDLKNNGDENINIILVGNKIDLENDRDVTTEEGEKKAILNKASFIETSAKNGNNIEKAFNLMIENVYENFKKENENKENIDLNGINKEKTLDLNSSNNENQIKKKKCCGN
jgi:Ras-related protein Rab-11A